MESTDDNLSPFPGPSLPAAEIFTLTERLLTAEEWEIRAAAAKELGKRGDLQAVEPLCIALKDKIWRVRMAAVGALGHLKDPRAVEPLCGALQSADWYIRMASIVALQEIGDLRAVEPLCGALLDTEAPLRSAAAAALGRLDDIWAVEALCAALKDKRSDVRLSAGGALDRMGTAYTLPLRVLSVMTLTPAKMLNTLQALADASPRAILKAFEQVGGEQEIATVERLAHGGSTITHNFPPEIRELAKACLPYLQQQVGEQRARAELLRASSSPTSADTLLRPATSSAETPPEQLLRPIKPS